MHIHNSFAHFRVAAQKTANVACIVDETSVHRVMFDDKTGVSRRVNRERRQHMIQTIAYAVVIAVNTDLAVGAYLQR